MNNKEKLKCATDALYAVSKGTSEQRRWWREYLKKDIPFDAQMALTLTTAEAAYTLLTREHTWDRYLREQA